jgi:putative phosphoesterase
VTKIAVLSDIHGNSLALQAVLANLQAHDNVDYLLVLGDLAVFGPDPAGVLKLLRDQQHTVYVSGNTDRYLVQAKYPSGADVSSWQAKVLASFGWTADRLSKADLQFLARQHRSLYFTLAEDHKILAVHGSPRSDEESICPNTPEAELNEMLWSRLSYNLLLCAHTHVPLDRMINGRRVVNTGSVGLPFDGDPRAAYLLVELQPEGGYQVEFRRVAYDIEAVVNELYAAGHPAAAIQAYNLRTASRLSPDLIYSEAMREGHALFN